MCVCELGERSSSTLVSGHRPTTSAAVLLGNGWRVSGFGWMVQKGCGGGALLEVTVAKALEGGGGWGMGGCDQFLGG